jgi:hypothetical protein
VLAYLSRYTHRVAISTSRLITFAKGGVTFRYKEYRRDGADWQRVMTLAADEFIRRFLLHVLTRGFHRIRHYGLLAGSALKASLALARELMHVAAPPDVDTPGEPDDYRPPCRCCGGRMIIIDFERWKQPRGRRTQRRRTGRPTHDPASLVQASAAGAPPPATDRRVSVVTIASGRVDELRTGQAKPSPGARRPPVRAHFRVSGNGRAKADIGRSSKSP